MGSGEGLDQIGRCLKQKSNAAEITVATGFRESFASFFSGRYTKAHDNEEADYKERPSSGCRQPFLGEGYHSLDISA